MGTHTTTGTHTPAAAFSRLASAAQALLAPGGCLILLCSPPVLGQRISRILTDECDGTTYPGSLQLAEKLRQAEDAFFAQADSWNWDGAAVLSAFEAQGFKLTAQTIDQQEERLIGPKDIDAWFDREKSRWGVFMGKTLAADDFAQIEAALRQRVQAGPMPWKWKSLLLTAQ
jgi:putative ATPase